MGCSSIGPLTALRRTSSFPSLPLSLVHHQPLQVFFTTMCSGLTENSVSDTKMQYVNYLYHYPHPAQRTMELLSVGLAAPLVCRVNRAFSQSQNQVFLINFHKMTYFTNFFQNTIIFVWSL